VRAVRVGKIDGGLDALERRSTTAGDGELVYAAVSRTLNPNSASDLAKDVTGTVAKDLKEKGLL